MPRKKSRKNGSGVGGTNSVAPANPDVLVEAVDSAETIDNSNSSSPSGAPQAALFNSAACGAPEGEDSALVGRYVGSSTDGLLCPRRVPPHDGPSTRPHLPTSVPPGAWSVHRAPTTHLEEPTSVPPGAWSACGAGAVLSSPLPTTTTLAPTDSHMSSRSHAAMLESHASSSHGDPSHRPSEQLGRVLSMGPVIESMGPVIESLAEVLVDSSGAVAEDAWSRDEKVDASSGGESVPASSCANAKSSDAGDPFVFLAEGTAVQEPERPLSLSSHVDAVSACSPRGCQPPHLDPQHGVSVEPSTSSTRALKSIVPLAVVVVDHGERDDADASRWAEKNPDARDSLCDRSSANGKTTTAPPAPSKKIVSEEKKSAPRRPNPSRPNPSAAAARASAAAARASAAAPRPTPTPPTTLTFQQQILLLERQQKELAQRNQQRQQRQNRQAVAQRVQAKRAEAEQERRLSDFHRAEIERLLSGRGSAASGGCPYSPDQAGIFVAEQSIIPVDPPAPELPPPLEHLPSLAQSGRQRTHLGRAMAPGRPHRGLEIGPAVARAGSRTTFARPSSALEEDLSKPPSSDHTSDSDEEVFHFRPHEKEVLLSKPGNKKLEEDRASGTSSRAGVGQKPSGDGGSLVSGATGGLSAQGREKELKLLGRGRGSHRPEVLVTHDGRAGRRQYLYWFLQRKNNSKLQYNLPPRLSHDPDGSSVRVPEALLSGPERADPHPAADSRGGEALRRFQLPVFAGGCERGAEFRRAEKPQPVRPRRKVAVGGEDRFWAFAGPSKSFP